MSKYKKSKIVNLFKIAYLPIIITIALVFFMSIISIHINSKNIINQYKEEGILLSNQIAFQLSKNIESQEEAERFLEGKIRTAAMTIHEIKEYELSNEWLEKMLDVFDVSELHYMDKDGEILFTTIEGYLGWKPHLEHPLYEFVNSTQKELMESIRPDDKYNIPTKYGALKADDGSFVQVGIDAQIVQDAKDQFSFQSVLDDVLKSPKVMSARYLDLDFNTVAYVQEKYISKSKTINLDDFNSSEDVLIEKVTSQLNQREIYTFYIPVFHNNQLEGILNIDYSLEQFYLYRRQTVWIHTILLILLILFLISFQYSQIILPVYDLEKNIKRIDVTNNILYKLPQERKQTFFGIVSIINGILDKTYDFIFELNETKEELKSSNEELSAAYEQIQASEEILREQYDEIVMQKKYIEDIGFNDELTGLLNRQGFIHSLKGKITLEKQGAMILMGIDNFKGLNNTLGHTFGDQVLIKVAQIIKAYSIITDSARFSGDEFIVYLSNIKNISDIDDFLNDIIEK